MNAVNLTSPSFFGLIFLGENKKPSIAPRPRLVTPGLHTDFANQLSLPNPDWTTCAIFRMSNVCTVHKHVQYLSLVSCKYFFILRRPRVDTLKSYKDSTETQCPGLPLGGDTLAVYIFSSSWRIHLNNNAVSSELQQPVNWSKNRRVRVQASCIMRITQSLWTNWLQ